MTIRSIVLVGEEILRQKSLPITLFKIKELELLQNDLRDTLLAFWEKNDYGRGIAAVQIGILKRAIYVKTSLFEGMLLNPIIIKKSKKMFWTWDSCFSANISFFVKILRYYEIEVEYFDLIGERKIIKAEGDLSELLQHELDHLEGILFFDYLDKEKRLLVMKEVLSKQNT